MNNIKAQYPSTAGNHYGFANADGLMQNAQLLLVKVSKNATAIMELLEFNDTHMCRFLTPRRSTNIKSLEMLRVFSCLQSRKITVDATGVSASTLDGHTFVTHRT